MNLLLLTHSLSLSLFKKCNLFGYVRSQLQLAGSPLCLAGPFVASAQTPWLWHTGSGALRLPSLQQVGLVAQRHVGSQFPDQGSNPGPPHCKAHSLPLDYRGSSPLPPSPLLLIEIQLMYSIVLVSVVQQSDLDIYIYVLFKKILHYRLLQDIKHSSLGYTVNPCLSALYMVVYLLIP